MKFIVMMETLITINCGVWMQAALLVCSVDVVEPWGGLPVLLVLACHNNTQANAIMH